MPQPSIFDFFFSKRRYGYKRAHRCNNGHMPYGGRKVCAGHRYSWLVRGF